MFDVRTLPQPPACTGWCERQPHGWDVCRAAAVKTCEREFPGDDLALTRFAEVRDGAVVCYPPMVRFGGHELTTYEATGLADRILRAALMLAAEDRATAAA